ncbi:MauE/DoxX family redox-associated membrane protein [Pedobacter endophyticus]|uniref:Methylamine utilisation protein MauE domain-containing protein n=1 Tax=Pedobacter endophyticus TaxID=2789740 RepID=A0A7U3Q4Y3_9SPHI|nr:MauE/DoxX family redox-associated membrane protein [Pedobacter endophyticus]QPH38652.1 hypothetical protein IZT61_16435 [Pedobacter endophyticus]
MENSYSNKWAHISYDRLVSHLNTVGILLLTLLWSYAVFAKLADLKLYQLQMKEQPFSYLIQQLLTFLVPILELTAAALLIFNKHKWGLWLSLSLILGFSIYITLILTHVFPNAPCSCGGFISKMSWEGHLYFNMLLFSINLGCLIKIIKKERRLSGKE